MAESKNPITPEQARVNRDADFARAEERRNLMAQRRRAETEATPRFTVALILGPYRPHFTEEAVVHATQLAYDYLDSQLPQTKVI